MPFDLPALLSEYLLPLLMLVPLAVVVVLIAARSNKDDHWSHSRNDLLGPGRRADGPHRPDGTHRSALPTVRPDLPRTPMPSPFAPVPPPAAGAEAAPTAPSVPQADEDTHETTEPMGLGPAITPYLSPEAPAPQREPTPPVDDTPRRRAGDAPVLADGDGALQLPRRRASDRLPSPAAPAAGATPILIVDDSAVVRAKLGKLLTSNGYAVTAARHGQEALDAIGQQWFAVMITDLEMPEMDGFELIAHVTGDLRTENLPIVAITGHEALHAQVHDAKGLFGIFKKPWNDRELLQRVAALSVLRPRA